MGGWHTIIKKLDGTVYGAGCNERGQLGNGYTAISVLKYEKTQLPSAVTETNKVKYIKAGKEDTTILLTDRTVWSLGANTKGELGNGTNINSNTFVQGQTIEKLGNTKTPLTSVLMIGRKHNQTTGVITEDGNVYTTGDNTYGQICDDTTESTNYYKKMGYVYLEYEDREITIDEKGYQIDLNKLQYIPVEINVYNESKNEYTLGEIRYISSNTNIATVDDNGLVTGNVPTGKAEIKIEDITNGYETNLVVIIKIRTQIIGKITTENLEGRYKATVKLYRRKRKEDEESGDNYDVENEEILITEMETNEDGSYVLGIDEMGVYDVLITKPGYLNYKIAEIEIKTEAIVEIEEYKLLAEDVAEDGEIEIDDLVDMNDNVGKVVTEENKEEIGIYGLNEDGIVDIEDRNILKKNYGKKAKEIMKNKNL